jgi:hypothetical protein
MVFFLEAESVGTLLQKDGPTWGRLTITIYYTIGV